MQLERLCLFSYTHAPSPPATRQATLSSLNTDRSECNLTVPLPALSDLMLPSFDTANYTLPRDLSVNKTHYVYQDDAAPRTYDSLVKAANTTLDGHDHRVDWAFILKQGHNWIISKQSSYEAPFSKLTKLAFSHSRYIGRMGRSLGKRRSPQHLEHVARRCKHHGQDLVQERVESRNVS